MLLALTAPSAAMAITTFTASGITTDNLTANGNLTANDASADTILLGQNGGTPDTVTIAGDVSLTDTNWAITAGGAFSGTGSLTISGAGAADDALLLAVTAGGASKFNGTITSMDLTASRTWTLPDETGKFVLETATQTLTNKSLTAPVISGATLSVDDTGSAFNVLFVPTSSPSLTADRQLTFNVNNANRLVSLNGDLSIQGSLTTTGANALTLATTGSTSLTLPTSGTVTALGNASTGTGSIVLGSSPTISSPRLDLIADSTGTNLLTFTPVASAVNVVNVSSAATGTSPQIRATGTDANVALNLVPKGTGAVQIDGKNLKLAGDFATSGANSLTFTTTGATSLTLPTSGTLASTSSNLGAFAATTSAQLATVLSDETGTGAVVFGNGPALSNPRIGTIKDTNGADALQLSATASAVNAFQMFNAQAGSSPMLAAVGADTNLEIKLEPKGNGGVRIFNTTSGADQIAFQPQSSATGASFIGTITTADLAGNQTYTLPATGGTIALTTDITNTSGWTDGGSTVSLISNSDSVAIGSASAAGKLDVSTSGSPAVVTMAVKGDASQTADLQQWYKGGSLAAKLDNNGNFIGIGNGGSYVMTTSGTTTVDLFGTTPTTVNFAGAATTLNIGSTSGTTLVKNFLTVNQGIGTAGSGLGGDIRFTTSSGHTIYLNDDAANDSNAANSLTLRGANKTSGTGAGGGVFITGGSSTGGAAGTVNIGATTTGGVNLGSSSTGTTVKGALNVDAVSLTLDADNTGTGANVSIIANQGSANDGILRYNGTSAKWEMSSNGGSSFTEISAGAGGLSGTGVDGTVAFWTGASTLSNDSSNFVWDNTNKRLGIGTGVASATLTLAPVASSASPNLSGASIRVNGHTFTDLATAASGTNSVGFAFTGFAQPTLAAANSGVTTTDAATVYIAAGPQAGANMTITNSLALLVGAGKTRLAALEFGDTGGNGTRWQMQETAENALMFGYPGEFMRIDSTGNLGIGDSTPDAKLDVAGNAIVEGSLVIGNGTAITKHVSFVKNLDLPAAGSNQCSVAVFDTGTATPSSTAQQGSMITVVPMVDDAAWDNGQVTAFVEASNQVKAVFCADNDGADPAALDFRFDIWTH